MKFIFSRRSWIIYSLFLVPPFFVCFAWLLIPVETYFGYALSIALYFTTSFFAWIFFYDAILPGCSKYYLFGCYILFLGPMIAWLSYLHKSSLVEEKLSYTLINGFRLVTSSLCYFLYVFMYRSRISGCENTSYQIFEEASERTVSLGTWLADKFCFKSSIDTEKKFSYFSQLEASDIQEDDSVTLESPVTYRNLTLMILYQSAILCTWVWLQVFTDLVEVKKVFDSSISAIGGIIIFQASRIVVMTVCSFINSLLPKSVNNSIEYFTAYQLQMEFLLYYRILFVNFSGWGPTVAATIVTFIFDVLYYPLRMTKGVFDARYKGLREKIASRGIVLSPAVESALFPEVQYETYVDDMSVEYFYEKISDYYSLFTGVFFISFLRVAGYQSGYYHFSAMTTHGYEMLMFRYLYLLCFEAFTDFLLRVGAKRFLDVDISNKGRNKTITNYKTRFLFAVFLAYDLLTVYYSELTAEFES